jgi:tetratricopeptide (TPR) repeat protein
MTFWNAINGRPTDLDPLKDPSKTLAMAEPLIGSLALGAAAVGFAFAVANGYANLFEGFLFVRGTIFDAADIAGNQIPRAMALLEAKQRAIVQARIEQAVLYYSRALDNNPANVSIWKKLVVSYACLGRLSEAMNCVDHILLLHPTDSEAWLRKGTLCLACGEIELSRDAFEHAAEAAPGNPECWSNLGLIHQQLGNREIARSCWQRAADLEPNGFSGWLNLGQLAYALGLVSEGVEAWTRACILNPQLTPVWKAVNDAGDVALAMGNTTKALESFERAARLNPRYPDPVLGEAICSKQAGDTGRSLQLVDSALEIHPHYPRALLMRGNLLEALGQPEAAKAAWIEAYSYDPLIGVPWLAVYQDGCKLLEAGRYQGAIDMFLTAISLYEPFTDAWFKLGVAHRPLGHTEDVRKCWLRILELAPNHSLALMNLANLEFESGNRKRALDLWDAALETNPDLIQALLNKGAALADDGDLDQACDLFTVAAEKGSKAASRVLALAEIYREMDPAVGPLQKEE